MKIEMEKPKNLSKKIMSYWERCRDKIPLSQKAIDEIKSWKESDISEDMLKEFYDLKEEIEPKNPTIVWK